MKTRIYLAEAEGKKYLVDTSSIGAARTAVAKKHITVRLAKPSEIVQMMRDKSAEVLVPSADTDQVDVEDVPPQSPPQEGNA
jgi:hypothetical protein